MSEESLSRLRWRCRRGMRELDLLLERFLADGYAELDAAGREDFSRLLDCADDVLFDYFYQGREPEDAAFARLVARIRDHYRH